MRRGNLHGAPFGQSRTARLRRWLEVLVQPKLIGAARPLILHGIHALANKMQAQAAGLDFVETAATQLCGVDRGTLVTEQNLKTIGALGRARADAAAIHFVVPFS